MDMFNSRVEEFSGGSQPVITANHEEYQTIFSADLRKLSGLIDSELEMRQGAVEQ